MLKEIVDIEAFKKAGYSFEEIQTIQESEAEYKRTGKGYSLEEVMNEVDKEVFSEARGMHA